MVDPALRLSIAVYAGDAAALRSALAAGADPNGRPCQRTPLADASERGHLACVEALLAAGANPNGVDQNIRRTPLHAACDHGHAHCVEALLRAGADPAVVNKGGWSALVEAAYHGRLEVASALLAAAPEMALITTKTSGNYPVQRALMKGHLDVARCLLELGPQSPAAAVLQALSWWGSEHHTDEALAPLYVLLAARQPLTPAQWAQVPWPCPGLGTALPAVLARSEDEARQLVAHLPHADKLRLRTAALCIARVERRWRLQLPADLLRPLLAAALQE